MLPVIIPLLVTVIGASGTAIYRRTKPGVMTPERKKIYLAALKTLKKPDQLRKLAEGFRKEGLRAEAELLEKRAALRELPAETQQARRAVFRKAIQSKNKNAVLNVAAAFMADGATGAGAALKKYAESLPAEKV